MRNLALFILCTMMGVMMSACAGEFTPQPQLNSGDAVSNTDGAAQYEKKLGALTYVQDPVTKFWDIPQTCTGPGDPKCNAVGPIGQRLMCDPDGMCRYYLSDDNFTYAQPFSGEQHTLAATLCLNEEVCDIPVAYQGKELVSTCIHTQNSDPDGQGTGVCFFAYKECKDGVGSPCLVSGVQLCEDGECTCSVAKDMSLALAESCDGVDNDCDGDIDEVDAIGCKDYWSDDDGDGYGNAAVEAVKLCLCGTPEGKVTNNSDCNDSDSSINPEASEVCDSADNDCNGETDETYTDLGDNCGVGACAGGSMVCSSDKSGTVCSNANKATAEVCDGADNDCDGDVDETFTDLGSGCGEGACSGGSMVCLSDGSGTTCSTAGNAIPEVCDGADNDCDGDVDEIFTDLGNECGLGACSGGSMVCSSDKSGTVCSTDSKISAEVCDGADNDCNGQTDEIFVVLGDVCGVGACAGGTMVCSVDGTTTMCNSDKLSSAEVCDGADNDCNGSADETFTDLGNGCGEGACSGGSMVCLDDGSSTVCSTAGNASADICNQIDDDCDGVTDVGSDSESVCDLNCPTVKKYACGVWVKVDLVDSFADNINKYQCGTASKPISSTFSAKELFVEPLTGTNFSVQTKTSGVLLSMLKGSCEPDSASSVGPTKCLKAGLTSVGGGVKGSTYAGIDAVGTGSKTVEFMITCN